MKIRQNTVIIVLFILCIVTATIYYKIDNQKKYLSNINRQIIDISQQKIASRSLDQINSYQAKYWEIITRNNVLLVVNNEYIDDIKELDSLIDEIKNKIKNKTMLDKYNSIEKFEDQYSKTTLEINEVASKHCEVVDKFLNDIYRIVQHSISSDDFEKLRLNQKKWLKEVESYRSTFESQKFGTIGTLIYLNYQIRMRSFRTLLLMLYL